VSAWGKCSIYGFFASAPVEERVNESLIIELLRNGKQEQLDDEVER